MAVTYDEILGRMENKYRELAGYPAARSGDTGIRIRLLAGELYSLTTNIDWLKRQMFPHTATGEQLELHAAQRGLSRRIGNKSSGYLIFRLDHAIEYDVVIPRGTVCSTADGALRYITDSQDTILRGSTFVVVSAKAEKSGSQYNAGIGEVKTIVTPFAVAVSLSNSSAFSGGTDDESDDSLRNRILDSLRNPVTGANEEYYKALAVSVDGVQSATAHADSGSARVTVYAGGRGVIPSDEVMAALQDKIQAAKSMGISVNAMKAQAVNVDVSVNITVENVMTSSEITARVRENIHTFFENMSVGESFRAAALGKAVLDTEGVLNYSFSGVSDVAVSRSEMAMEGTVTIRAGSNDV